MVMNIMKSAIRHLQKNRFISTFSIVGLALGMSAAALLLMYVHYETHFDDYHSGADRTFRIYSTHRSLGGEIEKVELTMGQFAPALTVVPGVESACRFFPIADEIRTSGIRLAEPRAIAADAALFDIFSFTWISLPPGRRFADPKSAVISRSLAMNLWGKAQAAGRSLNFAGRDFQIVGVFDNNHANSEMQFDLIVSVNAFPFMLEQQSNEFHTFFTLTRQAIPAATLAAVSDVCARMLKPREKNGYFGSVRFQRLRDVHLHSSDFQYPFAPHGNRTFILILAMIAGALVLLSGLNFTAMQTAKIQLRLKEMAIRKVIGAGRLNIFHQLLIESMLCTAAAGALAMISLPFLLGPFAEMINPVFSGYAAIHPLTWKVLLSFVFLVGTVATVYPYVQVSRSRPVSLGRIAAATTIKRRMLTTTVFIQFAVVVALLAAVLFVHHQLRYMLNKDLGFAKDALVLVDYNDGKRYPALRRELLQNPLILNVAASMQYPGIDQSGLSGRIENGRPAGTIELMADRVSESFVKTFGIKIIAGRDFHETRRNDDEGVLINERAARAFNLAPSEIIGRRLDFDWGVKEVVGVFQDYHYSSLHTSVAPQVLCREGQRMNYLSIRIQTSRTPVALAAIQKAVRRHSPDSLFNYFFLNERLRRLYQDDRRAGKLLSAAAFLALFLSALGLFAMASQLVTRRTKEIGVRKVLGATRWEVTGLLLRDLCQGAVWANLLAIPVAWYGLNRWLAHFAYHVRLGPAVFLSAALIALGIALLTVLSQTLYAASRNPVESLRYE
jgi:putative ABC transport system permease protein